MHNFKRYNSPFFRIYSPFSSYKNWKIVLIGGLIGALLFSGFAFFNVKHQITANIGFNNFPNNGFINEFLEIINSPDVLKEINPCPTQYFTLNFLKTIHGPSLKLSLKSEDLMEAQMCIPLIIANLQQEYGHFKDYHASKFLRKMELQSKNKNLFKDVSYIETQSSDLFLIDKNAINDLYIINVNDPTSNKFDIKKYGRSILFGAILGVALVALFLTISANKKSYLRD